MKSRDTVMIYRDPKTCQRFEGYATLIRKLGGGRMNGSKQEMWFVRFPDGSRGNRWINVENH